MALVPSKTTENMKEPKEVQLCYTWSSFKHTLIISSGHSAVARGIALLANPVLASLACWIVDSAGEHAMTRDDPVAAVTTACHAVADAAVIAAGNAAGAITVAAVLAPTEDLGFADLALGWDAAGTAAVRGNDGTAVGIALRCAVAAAYWRLLRMPLGRHDQQGENGNGGRHLKSGCT
ncbi:unnamed protein product [Miscanthus lutarioriparius]|uniref:Uncharacterized protein n=1 Tax=Miscanthus lutarioriparius TaxID=422564 RepID=A0A811NNI0_9POAL|nr:unnamed protein product [Miscanthus lutarioriparius]